MQPALRLPSYYDILVHNYTSFLELIGATWKDRPRQSETGRESKRLSLHVVACVSGWPRVRVARSASLPPAGLLMLFPSALDDDAARRPLLIGDRLHRLVFSLFPGVYYSHASAPPDPTLHAVVTASCANNSKRSKTVTTATPSQATGNVEFPEYAHPEVLVSAEWVQDHLNDPKVRIVESDEDVLLYDRATSPARSRSTGTPTCRTRSSATTSSATAFAAAVLRQGHRATTRPWSSTATRTTGGPATPSGSSSCSATTKCQIMNGGRKKWMAEGRPLTTDVPRYPPTNYQAPDRDDQTIRAFRDEVRACTMQGRARPADRRPHRPASTPARCCTCPTIRRKAPCAAATSPARRTSPGRRAVNDDGTFKSADELRGDLRQAQGSSRQRRRRLLPHRRALQPHLVRADLPARLSRRCATTTAPGPSGATWSAPLSRRARASLTTALCNERGRYGAARAQIAFDRSVG